MQLLQSRKPFLVHLDNKEHIGRNARLFWKTRLTLPFWRALRRAYFPSLRRVKIVNLVISLDETGTPPRCYYS